MSEANALSNSSGSKTRGNLKPKNTIGYLEKKDPTKPEIGITIMHRYKRKWLIIEPNFCHFGTETGNDDGGFFNLQAKRTIIIKLKMMPIDLCMLNHSALELSGPFGISTMKTPTQS